MSSSKRWGKQKVSKPDGEIRRSQALTTYGPGAMIDLIDQAVLVGGLDFWRYDPSKGRTVIHEARLRDAIAERFRKAGRVLSSDQAFLEPPAGDAKQPSRNIGIDVLEMPQWFVCQNPECRALIRSNALELKRGRYRHQCSSKKVSECVPVRFVAACRRGHLEEFSWISYAHRNSGRCDAPSLRLLEGATGDFSEIHVVCACGASESLSTALVPDSLPPCRGERPWLGREGREECSERLRMLVRTASNAYFSQIESALSVPERGRELADKVSQVWDVLQAATAETIATFRTIPKVKAALDGHDDSEVLAAIRARKERTPVARERLRTAEFNQLVSQPFEKPGELPPAGSLFHARRWRPDGELPPGIAGIVLAHSLREVRVQVGFTRLEAPTPNLQGEYDLGVESAALGLTSDWLPATEIRGEGIMVQLDEEAVQAWERRPAVMASGEQLARGYDAWAARLASAPPFLGTRFYLLHSLSHLLLTAISLECGYAASALSERIYCEPANAEPPMAAILLSTGTSGTEGTLGGLVEQGRSIRRHLQRAFDLGALCANDPVCAGHSPADDPAERFLEGAACHGCLFIAECSCERFNRYLDRALVVPAIGHDPELAFFSRRP
jgi:hypothetical protein